ncbi:protein FAM234B [Xenopus laevis]|uniref:FAM234A/B beta-propeller domain-containing protein n=2 Tax=Xenopus laevis TaxID=8355 RepID=A0A974HP49_XENLA|nr:protein FAM234B [Xenopus laevis]OCT85337.1 hypothetical protein XELAEV_18023503mg [Xenopus laevis]
MATVLSRALKLPGKKSHDPREYDPLTQADSDESEDDLVINIQHNGVQNGKGSRGSYHDPDSDVERASKRVQQRPVDAKEEGLSPSGGLDLELKATSPVVSYIRTTVFLLTVVVSMIMVLICAFLIPCPHRGHHQFWTLRIGQETGIPSPLELFDVNMDGVPDILISFASPKNVSQDAMKHHNSVAALSGINNSILWSSRVQEEIQSIKCGLLLPDSPQNNTCLLIGRSKFLQLVNATSGKPIWTSSVHLSNGALATSAIVLPDLNGDYISDLLVLTVGEQQPHLGFQLVSGLTGHLLGEVVKYEATVKGKLQGPQVHYTTQGAIYILFGFGSVQAVALKDIYTQAKTGESLPKALQKEDPEWEKWRTVNGSQTINVYRTGVEFLQSIPVLDSNCSDLLITTTDGLTLLRGKDLEKRWAVSLKNVKSQPQTGHFNPDGSLDFLLQIHSNNTSKRIVIIDGTSGVPLWEWEVPWHVKEAAAASVPTSDGKSAFVFWGDGSLPANSTNLNIQVDTQWNRHLLLLHPSYPGVILDIFNVSANIVTMEIGIKELEKDAFVVIVTSDRNIGASDNVPQTLVVSKLALRWAMSYSHPLSVGDAKIRPKVDDVKRILSRLKFGTIPQKP